MDPGVVVSGAAVSVSAWAARATPAPAGKMGHLSPSLVTGGENAGLSGGKTTWHETWKSIGAASVASSVFRLTLVVSLGAVGARGLPLVGGLRRGALVATFVGGAARRT